MMWRPRVDKQYPYDFDASERITRFLPQVYVYPTPQGIGYIDGFVPLFNDYIYAFLWRTKSSFGPGTDGRPVINAQYQMSVPGLTKLDGTI